MKRRKRRMRVEAVVALVGAVLAIAALIDPQWIERLFDGSPDHGSGVMEWALPLVLFSIAAVAGLAALRDLALVQRMARAPQTT